MKINLFERNFTADIHAHHNHTGDPSKENIGASLHDIERIIGILFIFDPVGTDEWPVGTGEPSVESILVAKIGNTADFDLLEMGAGVENPFGGVFGVGSDLMEHRNGDTPRDLAGNVPIFEILEIIDKDLFLTGWGEFDFAGFEMFDGFGGKTFDVDEPLAFKHRFDRGTTFVAMGNRVDDVFFAAEKTLLLEVGEDFFTAFLGGEASISFASGGEHFAVFADDLDAFEIVTFANFEIVEIVSGGNLDGTGTVCGVGVFVGNNRDDAVGKRELEETANEILVALVIRIDGDGDITEDGLGASGGDDNLFGYIR